MKILWLSNKLQSAVPDRESGTWLTSIAGALVSRPGMALANIAFGDVSRVERCDAAGMIQWAVPRTCAGGARGTLALPQDQILRHILAAIESFGPDVVHVWGVEQFWGLLTARRLVPVKAVLELQGLRGAIARVYAGGMTVREQAECITLRDVVRRRTTWDMARKFAKAEAAEREIMAGHRYVVAHSDWLEAQVRAATTGSVKILRGDLILREEFTASEPWRSTAGQNFFCMASYPAPFKGLHVAIRALARVANRLPQARLRIAGPKPTSEALRDSYYAWLTREAVRLGVEKKLDWLGPLTGLEIVRELRASLAMLIPTYIEGYCMALAEAMAVGTPAIVSFAGGTPYLAKDGESALYFAPGDDVMCARLMEKIATDSALAERLSISARALAATRNDPARILEAKLAIYEQVANDDGR